VSPRIYWLTGMAGTGKSTITQTMARCYFDDNRLGASFFFSRGGGKLDTARLFITVIAVQLAQHSPAVKKHICNAIAAHPNIAHQTLSDQWKRLVLRPFDKLRAADAGRPPSSVVVVIDALDECRDTRKIEFVLYLLSETSGLAVV
jgi:hypothetical protein